MDKNNEQDVYSVMYNFLCDTAKGAVATLQEALQNPEKIYKESVEAKEKETGEKTTDKEKPDYKDRYYILFEAISIAIENLQAAQQKTEETYMAIGEIEKMFGEDIFGK